MDMKTTKATDPIQPTVTTDFRTRVIAFRTRDEAATDGKLWKADGMRTRIIVRNGIANLLVAA